MSKDKAEQGNDTERRILEAAEQEFLTKGFAGARTTSIAEAAGVTHAMFHYYFRTKQKLFDRIVSEKINMLKTLFFTPVADQDLSLEDMLRSMIDRHLDFLAENPDLPRFILNEVYGSQEHFDAIKGKINAHAPHVLRAMQEKIDRAAAKGECRSVDAAALMLDIVSLNIFPFLATPMVNIVLGIDFSTDREFLNERKKNNFQTIMMKLRP